MKNKKLFAILTLVCFMFTLMPVAAFAADEVVVEVETTDYVAVAANGDDSTSVKVGDPALEVAVFKGNIAQTTASYYFWAENAKEEVVALGDGNSFEFEDVETVYVYAVAKTEKTTKVFEDAVADPDDIVNVIKARYAKLIIDDALTVKVKKADTVYSLTVAEEDKAITVQANENWISKKITVTLNKNTDTPVNKADIKFSTNSSYVTVEKVERTTTDRNGEQVISIAATKAGKYEVYADYEDAKTLEITVNVTPDDSYVIETAVEPARGVALGSSLDVKGNGFANIGFKIASVDGKVIDANYLEAIDVIDEVSDIDADTLESVIGEYRITVVEAPADSALNDIEDDALRLVWNKVDKTWVIYGAGESLDEEGTYTFKVALKDGNTTTATAKVVEFDEPVMMSLTMNETSVALNDEEVAATVKAVVFIDKNGTILSAAHGDYTKYAGEAIYLPDEDGDGYPDGIKGYKGIDYAGTGKALKNVDPISGAVYTVDYDSETKAYVGTTVTITAVNDKLEMTANATLTVVNKADGLKYESTDAEIAVNNELIVNTVDADGNVVNAGLSDDTEKTKVSVYVLKAPTNAAYSATAVVTDEDEVTVTFTASAAGEYKLQTIVRDVTNGKYYSSVDVITVGGVAGTFKDVVVMSIGANNIVVNSDVKAIAAAPMIQDGRTFVPFRALAEAFGAEVAWEEATQSVVAELNGVKVVMTIGANAYTVNGAAKTADVAPFINGASTMVPVRFVAEAFGINVTPIAAADGSIADVLFAK